MDSEKTGTFTVRYSDTAKKQIKTLDKPVAKKIKTYLDDITDSPNSKGAPLQENLTDFWRYRVGNYRIIVEIQEDVYIVLALSVGHRSKVYE